MTRRTISGGILLVWAGALGWLAWKEYRPRSTGALLTEGAASLPPGATYYTLSLGGQQLGFASNTVDTLADSIRVEDVMLLDVPVLGAMHRTDARTQASLTRQLVLKSFQVVLRGDVGHFAARGQVDGDSLLAVELESQGAIQKLRVPLAHPVVLSGLLPLRATFGKQLRVGNEFTVRVLDPLLMEERQVAVRVTGDSSFIVPDSALFDSTAQRWVAAHLDTVRAWRAEQEVGGVRLTAWIDATGRIVRATSPGGFTMERSAFEIAYENFRRGAAAAAPLAAGDVIRQTAVASNVTLAQQALSELDVQLSGVDLEGFDLEGGRQSLTGDTLIVQRESAGTLQGAYRLPASTVRFDDELSAEPLIQTTDPRVQAQARQIAAGSRDPRRVAEALTRWVYEHVDQTVTLSVPSAVQVLESRRGDCNEHTVLYVALARALGLPARTAAGLVYVNGRFYYHAWPEVYLNGWVAVDPTFGQFPADASHLRFTVGGLARQVELMRLIGRLELHVVRYQ